MLMHPTLSLPTILKEHTIRNHRIILREHTTRNHRITRRALIIHRVFITGSRHIILRGPTVTGLLIQVAMLGTVARNYGYSRS